MNSPSGGHNTTRFTLEFGYKRIVMTEGDRPANTVRALETRSEHEDIVFEQLDATKSSIRDSRFDRCIFRKVQLKESSFSKCKFESCVFESCDLSLFHGYDSAFIDVQFRECKLVGINWTDARRYSNISFEGCVLDYCSFAGLDFRKTGFRDCRLVEASFAEANLTDANFAGSDLTGCRFLRTNLTRCDLSNARGYVISPNENTVKGMKVSLAGAVSLMQTFGVQVDGF